MRAYFEYQVAADGSTPPTAETPILTTSARAITESQAETFPIEAADQLIGWAQESDPPVGRISIEIAPASPWQQR